MVFCFNQGHGRWRKYVHLPVHLAHVSTSLGDLALSQKLGEELQYEKEAGTGASEPDFIRTFKAQGVWTVSTGRQCLDGLFLSASNRLRTLLAMTKLP
jgi:hypothetical protein